ncbi:capsule assembly Wzi family protein [Leadbetterella byssophila]|uniref:capsule assembly Wzi family protein n=1 Tax=Leadbetterella byssophila TaxID=316068 RepID=UPI00399FE66A
MFRIFLFFLFLPFGIQAQVHLETTIGGYGNSGNAPFYLRTNQFGVVPKGGNIGYLRAKASREYDTTATTFDYGFSLEPVLNVGNTNQFILPEAYIKGKWKNVEIYGGRRKEIIGLTDTLLTSGSYIWSGNALPLWKIQAGIPEYVPVLKSKFIYVKGAIAHGWFDANRPVTKNVKLHQKWISLRIGKPDWKIKILTSFNHHVQWGGESPFFSVDGKLPDGLSNFPYVFFGTRNPNLKGPATNFDGENRIGNHLGTLDVGLDMSTSFGNILVYRQNIYEDGSLFFLNNIADGLNGITLKLPKFKWVSRINIEYLQTTSQGGGIFVSGQNIPGQLRGKDNYFNNAQYRDGWAYKSHIIGTPYIQTIGYEWDNPEYQIDQNRVKMWQGALSGGLPWKSLTYRLKLSYSQYWGTYQFPLSQNDQLSFYIDLNSKIAKSSNLGLGLGFDSGTLAPKSGGIHVSYTKIWK